MYLQNKATTEDIFAQSFAMQFISLMLFVLIFTVAAFIPKIQQKQEAPVATNPIAADDAIVAHEEHEEVILTQELDGSFFSEDGISLLPEKWGPYFKLTFEHDLSLVIALPKKDGASTVATASSLLEQCIRNGVPSTAVRFETLRDSSRTNPEIRVIKGDVSW